MAAVGRMPCAKQLSGGLDLMRAACPVTTSPSENQDQSAR